MNDQQHTTTQQQTNTTPTPHTYIDITPGPNTSPITCWETRNPDENTHKYRIETTTPTNNTNTVLIEINSNTPTLNCQEQPNSPTPTAKRIAINTTPKNTPQNPPSTTPLGTITITDTENTAEIITTDTLEENTDEATNTRNQTIKNNTGNTLILHLIHTNQTTITKTPTQTPETHEYTITNTDTQQPTETKPTTNTPTIETIKQHLPPELNCWCTDPAKTTPIESGVEITLNNPTSNPRIGELTQTNTDTENDNTYTVTLHSKPRENDTEYLTDSREYTYTDIEHAIETVTEYIKTGTRPETNTPITLNNTQINRDALEYSDITKHVVTDNNIERELYRLARLAGTDVWELIHAHHQKQFTQPDIGMELIGAGQLTITPPQPHATQQAVIEAIICDKESDEWKTVMQHIDDIIETFSNSITHKFSDCIHSAIESERDAVTFNPGEKTTVRVLDEDEFETAISESIETALGNTGIVFNDTIRDTLESILTEQLKTVQENMSHEPGFVTGEIEFTAEPWTQRAVELNVHGGMPWKAANVAALKETTDSITDKAIADKLDVDKSTVSRHVDTVERVLTESAWVTENVDIEL